MREPIKRSLSVVFAFLTVMAAVIAGGAFTDRQVSPAQEAEACGGLCVGAVVAGGAVAGAGIGYAVGHLTSNDIENDPIENLSAAELNETRLNVYEGMVTVEENQQTQNTTLSNYLQDTENVALVHGKNKFIKEVNNGSTVSTAETEAKQRITDYYAKRQLELMASWEVQAGQIHNSVQEVQSSGISSSENTMRQNWGGSYTFTQWDTMGRPNFSYLNTTSVALTNGTTADTVYLSVGSRGETGTGSGAADILKFYPDQSYVEDGGNLNGGAGHITFHSDPPDHVTSGTATFDPAIYHEKWSEIETRSSDAQAALDAFVNQTSTEIQNGAINSSDLVDPLIAKEYAPEDSKAETYGLAAAASAGVELPGNLSDVDHMTVDVNGTEYQGIVLSDTPPTDGFDVGTTYNTTKLSGTQYLLNSNGMQPMRNTEFTITSVNKTDGTQVTNASFEYTSRNYQTTDTQEYLNLMENISKSQAEIDARQAELFDTSGGGFLGLGSLGGFGTAAVVIGAAVVLYARGRNTRNYGPPNP